MQYNNMLFNIIIGNDKQFSELSPFYDDPASDLLSKQLAALK